MLFRLTSVVGKATIGLPYKFHPAVATSPCMHVNCCYSQQKIVRTHDAQRCPDVPPIPPKKDRTILFVALSVTAAALMMGGFVVYAKSDPQFRDWLTVYAPWADDFIAVAYQENMDYAQFVDYCIRTLRKSWEEEPLQVKPCAMGGDGKLPEAPPVKEIEPECEASKAAITDQDVCEMEECVKIHGKEILRCYQTVIDASQEFAKKVDEAMASFDLNKIKALETEKDIRNQKINAALETVDEDIKKLDELNDFLKRIDQKLPSLDKLKEYLVQFNNNIEGSRHEMVFMRHALDAYDIYYTKVIKLLDRFVADNKNLFYIDFFAEKPQISEDPDLFFLLTHRLMKAIEGDLNYMLPKTSEMASRGIAMLPEPERAAAQKKVDETFAKEKGKISKDIDEKLKLLQKELDDKANKTLTEDAAKFKAKADKLLEERRNSNVMQFRNFLRIMRPQHESAVKSEIESKTEEMIANLVAKERENLEAELSEMKSLVEEAEKKLYDALAGDRERKRARDLWEAGASILAAMKDGKPMVKVDKQIKLLEKAGKNDKLVITLLKSIPDHIRRDGVVPESVLRGRYHRMEDVALKVALVEKDGGPLPVYMMSFVQSLLLFIKFRVIPRSEIENPPEKPPENMDTFDLLQRARYWIDRGHLAIALRYVTALEGASRSVAETWLRSAKDYLQIRQAAEAVMSHATAISLNHI